LHLDRLRIRRVILFEDCDDAPDDVASRQTGQH
jgi:hypothetical protein